MAVTTIGIGGQLTEDQFHKSIPAKRFCSARSRDCYGIGRRPKRASVYNNLGTISYREGKTGGAGAQLKEALRLQPDYPAAAENLRLLQEARATVDTSRANLR